MKGLLILLVLVRIARSDNSTACAGLKPYKIVSPSAAGKWYLIKASKIGNVTENKNTCGFFNTISPCKCIGVNINTNAIPPNIQNYTLQNFGYNEMSNSYALTKIDLNSISNSSSIFNAYVPLARVNFTIAILGTDDYLSWIALGMCDILKDKQVGRAVLPLFCLKRTFYISDSCQCEHIFNYSGIVRGVTLFLPQCLSKFDSSTEIRLQWIITRSPVPTEETVNSATQAMKQASNSSSDQLIQVNQMNCPLTL